jgi:hypothetical protein
VFRPSEEADALLQDAKVSVLGEYIDHPMSEMSEGLEVVG